MPPIFSFPYCPHCRTALESRLLEGYEREVCPHCGFIHYVNPIPCAAAYVRDDAGRVLLVKRGVEPGLGLWGLPSGFIEIDESPESACLRELEEETGLKGETAGLIGVYTQASARYKLVVIIGYRVHGRGRLRPGSDSLDARYFPLEDLPELAFESHARIIRDSEREAGE
jgi:8-oxo-dGTP diphosphatase